jgi:general stress protein YciG
MGGGLLAVDGERGDSGSVRYGWRFEQVDARSHGRVRSLFVEELAMGSRRGFASMDKERQREIASQGGKAAHAQGVAHEFTSEEAKVAGRLGGAAVSADREYMREIGRKGGEARSRAAQQRAATRTR